MSDTVLAWEEATRRWHSLSDHTRSAANPEYKAGILGHQLDLEYCAGVLQRAIDNALAFENEQHLYNQLSTKADEYEETMLAEAIMESLR